MTELKNKNRQWIAPQRKKDKAISIRLYDYQVKALDKIAKDYDVKRSDVVLGAINALICKEAGIEE